MRPTRSFVAVALVGSLLAAGHADAAATYKPKTLQVTDASGDGNGLNDQGLGAPLPRSTPTATSQADRDIVKVDWLGTAVVTGKNVTCTGFTVTMTLAGPQGPLPIKDDTAAGPPDRPRFPGASTLYRVRGKGLVNGGASGFWWLQYDGEKTTIRFSNGSGSTSDTTLETSKPAVVSGSTITWTVTQSELVISGEKLAKFVLSEPGAEVRGQISAAGASWDYASADGAKTFKPC